MWQNGLDANYKLWLSLLYGNFILVIYQRNVISKKIK